MENATHRAPEGPKNATQGQKTRHTGQPTGNRGKKRDTQGTREDKKIIALMNKKKVYAGQPRGTGGETFDLR